MLRAYVLAMVVLFGVFATSELGCVDDADTNTGAGGAAGQTVSGEAGTGGGGGGGSGGESAGGSGPGGANGGAAGGAAGGL
jgi:hypothetical protein